MQFADSLSRKRLLLPKCVVSESGWLSHLLAVKPISLMSLAFAELCFGLQVRWVSMLNKTGRVFSLGVVGSVSFHEHEYFDGIVHPGRRKTQNPEHWPHMAGGLCGLAS